MDGFLGKIPLKWMIWGYPHFRKCTNISKYRYVPPRNRFLAMAMAGGAWAPAQEARGGDPGAGPRKKVKFSERTW